MEPGLPARTFPVDLTTAGSSVLLLLCAEGPAPEGVCLRAQDAGVPLESWRSPAGSLGGHLWASPECLVV